MPIQKKKPTSTKATRKKAESTAKQATGRKPGNRFRGPHPWEPNPRDMEWYIQWIRDGKSFSMIARGANPPVAAGTVCRQVRKIDDWMRTQLLDEILIIRSRHLQMQEIMISEALSRWREDGFEIEYAEFVRKTLADIRKMLGADKPTEISIAGDTGLPRVDGMSREEGIQATAMKMLETINRTGGCAHHTGTIARGDSEVESGSPEHDGD